MFTVVDLAPELLHLVATRHCSPSCKLRNLLVFGHHGCFQAIQYKGLWRDNCGLPQLVPALSPALLVIVVCVIHDGWSYWYMWTINRSSTLWNTPFFLETPYNFFQTISSWEGYIHRSKLFHNCYACVSNDFTDCTSGNSEQMGDTAILWWSS